MKVNFKKTDLGANVEFEFDEESSLLDKMDSLWLLSAASRRMADDLAKEFQRLDAEFAANKRKLADER